MLIRNLFNVKVGSSSRQIIQESINKKFRDSHPQPHLSRTHTQPFHPPLDYRNRRAEVHKSDIHPSLLPDQLYIRSFVQRLLCMA